MNIYKILQNKIAGKVLSSDEIRYFIEGITASTVSSEQAAAFLTAAKINGLSYDETASLTLAMADSGEKFDFKFLGKPIIDKHSTGGVGDKISLLLLPIMMSFDVAVPMISGRGLGHTGGTIDKLESIVGYNINPTMEEINKQMQEIGAMIIAQSSDLVPADKILYSIRDITATVDSDGLITSSILSKKIAEGLDGLVLDLKLGDGAFFKDSNAAGNFVDYMKKVSELCGLKIKICPTDMNAPIGHAIGNWLEIVETEESLKGKMPNDVKAITLHLASEMLMLAGLYHDKSNAVDAIENVLSSGQAFDNFIKWIEYQGGSLSKSRNEYGNVPMYMLRAENTGEIDKLDTMKVALAAIELGAGRKVPNDEIDYAAGIKLLKKKGDKVVKDEVVAVLFSRSKNRFEKAEQELLSGIRIIA